MAIIRDAEHFNSLLTYVEEINTQVARMALFVLSSDYFDVAEFQEARNQRQLELPEVVIQWLAKETNHESIRKIFSFTTLGRWLERDTWLPTEALTILVGLDPQGSVIDWQPPESSNFVSVSPNIRQARLLSDWTDAVRLPHSYLPGSPDSTLLTQIKDSKELGFDDIAEELWQVASHEREAVSAELENLRFHQVRLRSNMLTCITQRWYSSLHDEGAVLSPRFFIKWAEQLGFKIEWSAWAREQNLLDITTSQATKPSRKGGSEKYWTDERLLEMEAYRAKHTESETAEQFEISGSLVRRRLAEFKARKKPAPKSATPFSGLGALRK